MAHDILDKGRKPAVWLATVVSLGLLALALAGPANAAEKQLKPSSLIREGYGDFGGGEAKPEDRGDGGALSTTLVPDASAPGGYRIQLEEPGVTDLPGQAPSVIPDPSAPGGYRYQPGVMSDPDATPGQVPRVTPDPSAPGGYRINPLPGEAGLYGQPAPAAPPAPQAESESGLPPQLRWPGEDPEYRQRQEQSRQPNAQAPPQRYPWEPYQDRRSLRYRDQRQQAQEQAEQDRDQGSGR